MEWVPAEVSLVNKGALCPRRQPGFGQVTASPDRTPI